MADEVKKEKKVTVEELQQTIEDQKNLIKDLEAGLSKANADFTQTEREKLSLLSKNLDLQEKLLVIDRENLVRVATEKYPDMVTQK